MKTKKSNPKIISRESTDPHIELNDKKIIRHLKDEVREYKRQIKVLKRAIDHLRKNNEWNCGLLS